MVSGARLPCAPGAVKGGPKPATQLPAAVPSVPPPPAQPGVSSAVGGGGGKTGGSTVGVVPSQNRTPTSPTRTGGKGVSPRLPKRGPSTILLAAPVELPMSVVPPKPPALKRKAISPLTEHQEGRKE